MATVKLTKEKFISDIFDYTTDRDWKYKSETPAIIDFYADWCGPCKMIAPIMESISEKYKGKLNVYKVDTEMEQELSAAFKIRSIPSLLFIPVEGAPMMQTGALQETELINAIETNLL